jgi:hypothetical protein
MSNFFAAILQKKLLPVKGICKKNHKCSAKLVLAELCDFFDEFPEKFFTLCACC